MTINSLGQALEMVLTPSILFFLLVGILIGVFVGSLPGIGTSLGMAVVLPLTAPMEGLSAIILLIGIYSGAMYGGSIAAIIVNVPGTAAAAATTLDGYPMSQKGQAVNALSISATASALSGFLAFTILILISPFIIMVVLAAGSPEYFLVAVLGLATIVIVAKGHVLKGIIAGAFGFLLSTIGMAPMSPERRYTFDMTILFDGLSFIAALIAMFAIAEMLRLAVQEGEISDSEVILTGNRLKGVKYVLSRPVLFVKSTLIGLLVGTIPGAGGSISTFVAYSEAVRSSENPDGFGSGERDGVLAAEASNNATVGGALVPTLSFAIPGSGSTAVFLGGLIMHGIQPGPDLFTSQLHITYTIFLGLIIGNLAILGIGLLVITQASYLTRVDVHTIIPVVIVLSVLGAYALSTNWLDPLTVLVLGVIGFYMKRYNYSVIAFILGIILGPLAEENLDRSLTISGGSFEIFAATPIRILIILVIVVMITSPYLSLITERFKSLAR